MIIIECQNRLVSLNVGNGKILPMKNDTQPWSDQDYKIIIHPPYLKGGFLIQQQEKIIPKGTEISIVVTGNVTIYVAIQEQLKQYTGGYEVSLPRNDWKKKNGKIGIDWPFWDWDLTGIYSKDYRTKKKTTILLPPTTTTETTAIITVVPICSGKLKLIILGLRYEVLIIRSVT